MTENVNYPRTEYDSETGEIKFVPCVYEQRYSTIHKALQKITSKSCLRKVIDFGCAELGFFTLLKSLPNLEILMHIDVDEELLNDNLGKVKPLLSDYLAPKTHPFNVQIHKGNIAEPDPLIMDVDAIVCIELIEHLYPDVLEELPYVVFSISQPKLAIFTTPNVEYNVLFPNPERFRHYDHKFEWTRDQFQDWAHNICQRFPNYTVAFDGIGPPPKGYEDLGHASQMATFTRLHLDASNRADHYEKRYKLLYEVHYPIRSDDRSLTEKVLHEIQFRLARLSNPNGTRFDEFSYDNDNHLLIPVKEVLDCVEQFGMDEEHIINILLTSGFTVDSDKCIVLQDFDDSSGSESDHEVSDIVISNDRISKINIGEDEIWC